MSWFLFAFLAYLFLAISALFDRYLLTGPITNPKIYTIYQGLLGLGAGMVLLPFISLDMPIQLILLGVGAGLARIFAILFLAKSISIEEVSRVLPIVGALIPTFLFFLVLIFIPGSSHISAQYILAFVLLIVGSLSISTRHISLIFSYLKTAIYPAISAFIFAIGFLLTKLFFLKHDFLSGIFLILLGGGLGSIILLLVPTATKEVAISKQKTSIPILFVVGVIFGALGVLSQFYALFLADASQIPLINALEGIRDVFLIGLIYLISLKNPKLLREEMKGAVLGQKIFAILLIWTGLILLR